ncbi:hypothetical protein ACWGK6_14100 [Streptomyces violaceusniger]|uniref:hypothetical protein n=1 Tax=Streptomyces violaceusniger TaxID=68280 RepID=UPI003803CA40
MADPTVHHLLSYGTPHLPEVQLSQLGRLLDGSPDALPGHRVGARATRPATRLSRCPANTVAGWMRTTVPGSL